MVVGPPGVGPRRVGEGNKKGEVGGAGPERVWGPGGVPETNRDLYEESQGGRQVRKGRLGTGRSGGRGWTIRVVVRCEQNQRRRE